MIDPTNPPYKCLSCGKTANYLGYRWGWKTVPVPNQPGRTTEVRALICTYCGKNEVELIKVQ
jgi:DNA-directed RNA polymerase subunit RPC12/RpoP